MGNGNGHDFDHFHGRGEAEAVETMLPDESHPVWASERIVLKSTGIDIGSTTSHLMFSQIILRRQGISLSSRFQIVNKKIIYESPILITPFVNNNIIDTNILSTFIIESYQAAGIKPEEIETGAVIVTGEAARKDNAEAITNMFSVQAGKFVCATAGPNLEAKMAAYGSGAVEISVNRGEQPHNIMNIDLGGGTAKFSLAYNGAVIDTAAMNVGARLLVLNEKDEILRIEAPGQLVLNKLGLPHKAGDRMSPEQRHLVCQQLASCLAEVVKRNPLSPLTQQLMITPPLTFKEPISHLIFSGGVSEYIYGHEQRFFGDLGPILAEEIREMFFVPPFPVPVIPGAQRIRATVIGAAQYTVQVSGSTIFISNQNLLPLRNLQVIAPSLSHAVQEPEYIKETVLNTFKTIDAKPGDFIVALALRWKMGPAYEVLKNLCLGIVKGMSPAIDRGLPLVLIFDADVGRLVGNILTQELKVPVEVISIDGIELQDFDYIDIGQIMPEAQVVPVVIKSLIFRT